MLKLKICGLKDPENIKHIISLKPDMIGFVFYEKSPRNIAGNEILSEIPADTEKVGVFVDSDPIYIDSAIKKFRLNAIQLYHEDLKPFQRLRTKVKLIKAISIENCSDIYKTRAYQQDCDTFLFDTRGKKAGGNGKKFDWEILHAYTGRIPFFLSGGISPADVPLIKKLKYENMIGIDINSKFELEPGLKNIEAIKQFKEELYENIEYLK
jgi:phosphoribosylanthranilate isomerase